MDENEGKRELVFLYNNQRCHARVVKRLLGKEKHIGDMDGYSIYQIEPHIIFDQFGFVAVAKNPKRIGKAKRSRKIKKCCRNCAHCRQIKSPSITGNPVDHICQLKGSVIDDINIKNCDGMYEPNGFPEDNKESK